MVVRDVDVTRAGKSVRRTPTGGYRTPSMRRQAQEIIRSLDGVTEVPRRSGSRPVKARVSRDFLRRMRAAPETTEDTQIAPGVRRQPHSMQERPGKGWHPLVWFGLGMCVLCLVWSVIMHVSVWYTNTFYDPSRYTQTAHQDSVDFKDAQSHQYEAHAFIDQQNHLDVLVIPSGDTSKTRIFVGPALASITDPQHRAMITVTAHGTQITVSAKGPLTMGWLDAAPSQQDEQWTVDVSQQTSSEGGK